MTAAHEEKMTISNPNRRASLALLGGALVLGGCASRTNPLNPDIAPISFDTPPFQLGVEQIQLLIRPRLGSGTTPVDADFVIPPEEIAKLWPRQRLQATGGAFDATYIIDDASAVSRQTDEGELVVATMQVRLVLNTTYGVEEAGAGARVESELRIKGNPSIVLRQELLHGMIIEMAAELDKQMTSSINRTLSPYLQATPAF